MSRSSPYQLGGGRTTERTIRSDPALFQSAGALTAGSGINTCAKATGAGVTLLIAYVHSNDGSTVACAGFRQAVRLVYTGGNSCALLVRNVDGSEPSTLTFTGFGAGYNEAMCFGYNGTDVEAAYSQNGGSTSAGVVASTDRSVEFVCMDWDGGSIAYGGPSGWTVRKNGSASSYNVWAGDRACNAGGPTATANFVLSGPGFGNFGLLSCVIEP